MQKFIMIRYVGVSRDYFQEDSQGLAYSHIHGYDLLGWKDIKQSKQREKVLGPKFRGNQAQAPKSPLPAKSHGTP